MEGVWNMVTISSGKWNCFSPAHEASQMFCFQEKGSFIFLWGILSTKHNASLSPADEPCSFSYKIMILLSVTLFAPTCYEPHFSLSVLNPVSAGTLYAPYAVACNLWQITVCKPFTIKEIVRSWDWMDELHHLNI